MVKRKIGAVKNIAQRITATVLMLTLLCGLLPPPTAEAASWAQPYLDQLVAWGVMRGDINGNLHPDREITRAEFVSMVNRAYGYHEVGSIPFSDVRPNDWFYDDISIAYNKGYFAGTSSTTASPNAALSREQAAALLGRNMMLDDTTSGEVLGFTDSRNFDRWSRGMIAAAAEAGFISGNPDGSFQPKQRATRGEVAAMLVRAVGSILQNPGAQSLGSVAGNVTINTPGVKLQNTEIIGDLYLTGGVGLGDVELENVTVQGRIVVAGGGESQRGDSSVILRNVKAENLLLDSLDDQFMTIRAEGYTDIKQVDVRTDSFIEDVSPDTYGLQSIQLKGEPGANLQLAGNIKEVLNLTPTSNILLAQGIANRVTIDETAFDTTLQIENKAWVEELNLDVAADVVGQGDISHTNVNAPGATIEMLPDTIVVRPGITADIYDEEMDSAAAAQSSEDPRILSGYPDARKITGKTADIVFSTNKKGTLYWAVTSLADGSVSEVDLIDPPAEGSAIIKRGTLNINAAETEQTVKVSGLAVAGSYYVSAVLVDNRGMRSPVKIDAFTTPDDTVPNFTSGYPQAVLTEDEDDEIVVQASVMANKNCLMYYALLPKGATAPTAADFKAGSLSGNLGHGVQELTKNTPMLVPKVNSGYIKEESTYELYLWLTDIDGTRSSAVKKLTINTPDKTPPVIQRLMVIGSTEKTVSMSVSLDEPGTFFWAVVKQGSQFYQMTSDGRIPDAEELVAKIQIENGANALKSGKSNVSKAGTDVKFTVSGLEEQTTYDLYFVAKDKSGNYSVYTKTLTPPMQINTMDGQPPTVEQEFTRSGGDLEPYPDTSIRLVFSENVQGVREEEGFLVYSKFLELYQKKDYDGLAEALEHHVKLYRVPTNGGTGQWIQPRSQTNPNPEDWLVDYRKATVSLDPSGSGELIVTLPHDSNSEKSALNLGSGVTYYFELSGIVDTSDAENWMEGDHGVVTLDRFTTIDAQLVFSRGTSEGILDEEGGEELVFDMNFRITPVTATSVSPDVVWDMLFWSSNAMTFELYTREVGEEYWTQVKAPGNEEAAFVTTTQYPTVGLSVSRELQTDATKENNPNFEHLNLLEDDREYGIIVTKLGTSYNRQEWSGTVSIQIDAIAGDLGSMTVLANTNLTPANFEDHQQGIYKVNEIGVPEDYTVSCPFRDTSAPTFIDGYPTFEPGDSGVDMNIMLSRNNASYYYVVTAVGNIPTILKGETASINTSTWSKLPENGEIFDGIREGNVISPGSDSITSPPYNNPNKYIIGQGKYSGGVDTISIEGQLAAKTKYVAYFVVQGESPESISEVYAFRFETMDVVRPIIDISIDNPSAILTSDRTANVKYMVVIDGLTGTLLSAKMDSCWDATAAAQLKEDYNISDATLKEYQSLDLLNAMKEHFYVGSENLGSVFDLFVAQSHKDKIAQWFASATTDGTSIVKVGEVSLITSSSAAVSKSINCKENLQPGQQQYWFVAMGKSPLGSGYAFASGSYLFYPDESHPVVTSLSTEVQTPVTDDYKTAVNTAYTGTVTVAFNTALYYKQGSNYLQVVDKSMGAAIGLDGKKYVLSSSLLRGNNVQIIPQDDNAPDYPLCSSLTLSFNAIKPGNQIVFSEYIANSRGKTGSKPLTLIMKLEENEYDYFIPTFYISAEEWNGIQE